MTSCVHWETNKRPPFPKKETVLIFTSLQYKRRPWISWIRRFPTALLVHNANFYLGNPIREWGAARETKYASLRYGFEKSIRFPYKRRVSQIILSQVKVLIPYSSLQIPFLRKYYLGPIVHLPIIFKKPSSETGTYDFIAVYGKVSQIDLVYLKQIRADLNQHHICLCLADEKKTIQRYLPNCKYIIGPVSHKTYIDLFKKARRVIFPFRREMVFGVVREVLGETKYLARIYTALMYNKPVLFPSPISLPELPKNAEPLEQSFQELVAFLENSH
jgi:hypothetical protein